MREAIHDNAAPEIEVSPAEEEDVNDDEEEEDETWNNVDTPQHQQHSNSEAFLTLAEHPTEDEDG